MEKFDEFSGKVNIQKEFLRVNIQKEFLREISKIESHTLLTINGSVLESLDKKEIENNLNTIYIQLGKLKEEFKNLNLK